MTYLQVVLLPWLHLREPVEIAGYRYEQLSTVVERLDAETATAVQAVASTYREIDDRPVDPVIVWPREEGATPGFDARSIPEVALANRFLLVAALSSVDYFTLAPPVNATHVDLVAQNFTPGSNNIALWSRRRDGETMMGGHTMDDVRFVRPVQALPTELPSIDTRLQKALSDVVASDTELGARIGMSSDSLRRGNRLDPGDDIQEDVVWCVSALEQLLNLPRNGKAEILRSRMADHLAYRGWGARVAVREWTREAYDTRSELHGKSAKTNHWHRWIHALLATEAYCLVVKNLLVHDSLYELSTQDEDRRRAFARRAMALRTQRLDDSPAAATGPWHEALSQVQWLRRRADMTRHLEEMLGESE